MDWIIFVKWGKARYDLGRLVNNIGRRLGVDRLCKCAYIFLQLRKNTMHINLDGNVAKWETIRTKAISIFFKYGKAVCKCIFLARDNVGVAPRT